MYIVAEVFQSQYENWNICKGTNIYKLLYSILDVTFIDCTQHQPLETNHFLLKPIKYFNLINVLKTMITSINNELLLLDKYRFISWEVIDSLHNHHIHLHSYLV
jgi:hypothetical protein